MTDIGEKKLNIIGFFVLPIYLVYCEILFKLFTVVVCPPIAWITTIIFPAVIGIIASIFTGLLKNQKANRIARGVLMCVFALVFLVNIFIYMQFKIFYEPATVFVGAQGVVNNFMDHVWNLLFSLRGIIAILLYLVPIVLYFVFGKKFDAGDRLSLKGSLVLLVVLLVLGIGNLALIRTDEVLKGAYSERYNFQSAVTDFGILTGVRLELQRDLLRKRGINSTTIGNGDTEAAISPEEFEKSIVREGEIVDAMLEEAAANIKYEKNVLDIDFDELAQNTEDDALASVDEYVASLTPSSQNEYTGIFEGKNLIMITAEAFSNRIIDPELTPTLYRLATKGINFTDYTQQASAGTIGGEYQIIFGLFPSAGGESFISMKDNLNWFTMGSQLTRRGYSGGTFHNGEVTYYDRHITHNTIGYPDEYLARGNGMEELIEPLWPGSDREMFEATLEMYIDKQPFNLYYMTLSGHSQYGPGNAMSARNLEYVEHLDMSERLRYYYAANMEIEFGLTSIINMLDEAGILDDTVIVMSADHFPYGLDDDGYVGNLPYVAELYGYEPQNYLERDENGLIIWCREMEDWEPIVVDTPVSSLDILPTLSNLFGLEWDSRLLPGRDVFSEAEPLVFNFCYDWKTDRGTYIVSENKFTPVDGVTIPPGYVDRMNEIVRNKMNYCWNVMYHDYFRHVLVDSGFYEIPVAIDTPVLSPCAEARALSA